MGLEQHLRRGGCGYFSDSIRSTYSCIASFADLPLTPAQASYLARPDHVGEAGALALDVAGAGLLVQRVDLQQRHVVGLFRQDLLSVTAFSNLAFRLAMVRLL